MSTDNMPPPAERFKATLISMAKIIAAEVAIAHTKGIKIISMDIMSLGIEIIKSSDEKDIIEGFIDRSYNDKICYWDEILNKNESFFLDKSKSAILFGEISSGIVEGFIDLIVNKHTSDTLINTLWNYLHVLVKISIAYIFFEREPQVIKTQDGFYIKYSKNSRPYINLESEASKWRIDLLRAK